MKAKRPDETGFSPSGWPESGAPAHVLWTLTRCLQLLMFWLAALVAHAATNAPSSLTDDELIQIQFEQKLGNPLSLDLSFRDERGQDVLLRDYFQKTPVILVLGYYECPMLCNLVLNGMVESLQQLRLDAGDEFAVVCISIDPNETPELAAAKKRTYLKRYARKGAEEGWHFLTGDDAPIKQLADETGFRYAYDPSIKEYAHPSGLIILTPDGVVAHYAFGVTFSAKDLAADLKDAGARKVGSPIEQFILLCFHYSPLTGKYAPLIMTVVRVSGAVTLLALVGIVVIVSKRRAGKNRSRQSLEETAP